MVDHVTRPNPSLANLLSSSLDQHLLAEHQSLSQKQRWPRSSSPTSTCVPVRSPRGWCWRMLAPSTTMFDCRHPGTTPSPGQPSSPRPHMASALCWSGTGRSLPSPWPSPGSSANRHHLTALPRFLAAQFGLKGRNNVESAQVDEIVDAIEDVIGVTIKTHFEEDPAAKAAKVAELNKTAVLPMLQSVEKRLVSRGGQFLVCDKNI